MNFDCRKCLLFGALAIPSGRPTIEIQGFHLVESQGERRNVEMTARQANLHKNENISVLQELRAFVWGQVSKPFEASGKLGILQTETQYFEVQQSSRLVSPDGYLFETPSFAYDAQKKVFRGTEPVNVQQMSTQGNPPLVMSGLGFLVDLNKYNYEVTSNVSAKQILESGEVLTVKSQSAQMSPEQKNATFLRKVIVKSPQFEMKGERLVVSFEGDGERGEARSPRKFVLDAPAESQGKAKKISASFKGMDIQSKGLEVNFAPEGTLESTEAIGEVNARSSEGVKMRADRLITRVVDNKNVVFMKGAVTIQTDERTATCEDAEYYPENGNIVLKTVAAIKKGQQLLEGDVIRFSTKNSEILVDKARGQVNKKDLGVR